MIKIGFYFLIFGLGSILLTIYGIDFKLLILIDKTFGILIGFLIRIVSIIIGVVLLVVGYINKINNKEVHDLNKNNDINSLNSESFSFKDFSFKFDEAKKNNSESTTVTPTMWLKNNPGKGINDYFIAKNKGML